MGKIFILMGFIEVKKKVIKCLEEDSYIHEARENKETSFILKLLNLFYQ